MTDDELKKLGFRVKREKKKFGFARTTSSEREALREAAVARARTPAGVRARKVATGLTAVAGTVADSWTKRGYPDHMWMMRMYAREGKKARVKFAAFKSAVNRVIDAKRGN